MLGLITMVGFVIYYSLRPIRLDTRLA